MTPILRMENIVKTFPGVQALKNGALELIKGEIHALVGENGAGKSTLIKILAGIYSKDSGSVFMDGDEIEISDPQRSYALGFRFIHQEMLLVPFFTVSENIFLGQESTNGGALRLINRKLMREKAEMLLSDLGINIDVDKIAVELSAAEQQMVSIARSVVTDARILVLDEPTAPLSHREVENLFNMLRKLSKRGTTIIYITHRLEEIFALADRVTILRDGEWIDTKVISSITPDGLVNKMIGKNIHERYPERATLKGKPLLKVRNLSRRGAFQDISLELFEGEIVGIAGLVGAGRTEVLRALFGADPVDSGQMEVNGELMSIKSPTVAKKIGLGFIPEDRRTQGLVTNLSITNNVCLTLLELLAKCGFISRKKESETAKKQIANLSIVTPSSDQRVKYLSGGNQQKVVVSKWLARGSKVFLFDEPTNGIDVGAKRQIYRIMKNLTAEGAGILLVSSEIPELIGLCDRIVVMYRGVIVRELSAETATPEMILKYAMGGSAE